jgi:hypothetical protein
MEQILKFKWTGSIYHCDCAKLSRELFNTASLQHHFPRPTRPFSHFPGSSKESARRRVRLRLRSAAPRAPMARAHLQPLAAAQRRPTVALLLGLALAFCLAVLSIQSSFFAAPGALLPVPPLSVSRHYPNPSEAPFALTRSTLLSLPPQGRRA